MLLDHGLYYDLCEGDHNVRLNFCKYWKACAVESFFAHRPAVIFEPLFVLRVFSLTSLQGLLRQRLPADEGARDTLRGRLAPLPTIDPVAVVRFRWLRCLIEGGHFSCTGALAGHHFTASCCK